MSGFLFQSSIAINEIAQACAARRAAGAEVLDLSITNPTLCGIYFPPEILLASSSRYFRNRRYEPDAKGLSVAREAIARYYLQRTPAMAISPEHIILTASTSESYSLLFSLLCEPGDCISAPKPSYPLFEFLAAHHRLRLCSYQLDATAAWAISETTAPTPGDGTKAILVVSPHNPCGVIHDLALAQFADHDAPIIADEVFSEFCFSKATAPPLGTLYPHKPVFHLNGISKLFALPDLKLGWIAMNPPAYERFGERLEILNDTFLSGNTLLQSMLPDIFSQGASFVEGMISGVNRRLQLASNLLSESPRVRLTPPDGGYVLFPEILSPLDDEALTLRLIAAGVLVHPGYYYDMEGAEHLLVSCLGEESTLERGLRTMVSVLDAL